MANGKTALAPLEDPLPVDDLARSLSAAADDRRLDREDNLRPGITPYYKLRLPLPVATLLRRLPHGNVVEEESSQADPLASAASLQKCQLESLLGETFLERPEQFRGHL
ncbi:hypothetical protein QR680_004481 [Steinernema hermaphroditum]|uniref:Uncharacterized protein n=1 Tax=Steinernema hermaphroditum TaxID=289476 RepID=A0AA39HPW5_9BILA|nr:hypothetical protein QR680_004481 [Steinernema hermaphroditum]